jgi:1,4-dihydroxy-2-naphthoate polyprenyltransferase
LHSQEKIEYNEGEAKSYTYELGHPVKAIVRKTSAFVQLGRLIFLLGGVVFYNLGVVIAQYAGADPDRVSWGWGQLIVTTIQLMVHYSNDYFDIAADRENATSTRWSGGSRVLVLEILPPRTALVTAIVLLVIALLGTFLLYLAAYPGPLALPIIGLAIFVSWFYSAPPLRLHSQRIGEPCAALVVAALTTIIGYYLQTKRLDLLPVLAVLPLFFLQLAMLLRVSVDDIKGDTLVGKHTLAVYLGFSSTLRLIIGCLLLSYVVPLLLIQLGLVPATLSALFLTLPLGGLIIWYTVIEIRMASPQRRIVTFLTIALLVSSGLIELSAFRLAY